MRDRIVGLLEKADLAAASSRDLVSSAQLTSFATTVKNARSRLGSPDDVLVVALVGGTGSGKSSLFNAISGGDVAEVGGVRPTTGEPLASVSSERASALSAYLDELGVSKVDVADVPKWLCLIDMPDTDSVELDHRFQTERLLSRLDVLVWVVDPEKYRDAALHHRYLEPLSPYAAQFVFVLNQIDRLGADDVAAVRDDLEKALNADGIAEPSIALTAANPGAGPPMGIADLVAYLETIAGSRKGVYSKFIVDLARGTQELAGQVGSSGVGFDERVVPAAEETARLAAAGEVDAAIDHMGNVIEALAKEVSPPLARSLNNLAVTLPGIIREAADSDAAAGVLTEEIVGPVKELLARRATASAALVDLSLDLASLTASRRM
ncbi:MAG: GTPase [Actinomycetota bacterium]|nr:GTPase [Actinomycetota bacterium]